MKSPMLAKAISAEFSHDAVGDSVAIISGRDEFISALMVSFAISSILIELALRSLNPAAIAALVAFLWRDKSR